MTTPILYGSVMDFLVNEISFTVKSVDAFTGELRTYRFAQYLT